MHTDGTGISAAQLVAYRGGKSEGPENTLPSLARAAALGVASEVDVRVAADGVPVLAHDASMLRTAGQDLVVEQTSSAMLRRVRACHGHDVRDPAEHRVPSLAEAFEVFEGELVLDLRADAAGVREIAGVIDDCAAWDRVTIVSESEPTLRALLTLRPTARYGATRRRAWVLGVLSDKAVDQLADALFEEGDDVIVVPAGSARSAAVADVVRAVNATGAIAQRGSSVADGIDRASEMVGPGGAVLVVGSLYVAAAAREHLLGVAGEGLHIRPMLKEAAEIGADSGDRRLLQHDFRQPDGIRVGRHAARRAPREIAGVAVVPGEERGGGRGSRRHRRH